MRSFFPSPGASDSDASSGGFCFSPARPLLPPCGQSDPGQFAVGQGFGARLFERDFFVRPFDVGVVFCDSFSSAEPVAGDVHTY